jgi:hypothetical protein
MKIRKSRLKQIIQEEVAHSKFISINENTSATSLRWANEPASELLTRMANTLLSIADNADDPDRTPHSPNGPLSDIIGTLQQLIDDDNIAEDFFSDPTGEENAEAAETAAETSESTRLLDEIVVQEIIKALGEGPLSHTHQARALQKKAKMQGALGHNDAAALKYHLAQAEKEKGSLGEDYEPVFEKKNDDFLGDIKSTGEWAGDTVAQLKKKIATAKDDQEVHQKDGGKADPAITTKLRQMNFAKNAKRGKFKKGK